MTEYYQPKDLAEALQIIEQLRRELDHRNQQIQQLQQLADSAVGSNTGVPVRFARLRRQVSRLAGIRKYRDRAIIRRVLKSGLFDTDYYLKQCQGRADYAKALENPVLHYVEFGAYQGLDPSPEFDSDWYLASNQDVSSARLNPLLHYIEHGQEEGRAPRFDALVSSREFIQPTSATELNRRLWSGFPHLAHPALEELADHHMDKQATWYLAAWLYAHGDLETAVERIRPIERSKAMGRRETVGYAKCFTLLRDVSALAELLADDQIETVVGNAHPYLESNLERLRGNEEAALTAINILFSRVGLNGIRHANPSQPLQLNNLAGRSDMPVQTFEAAPKVSVIIPAYNAESTLPVALEGLLAQSWPSLEIIVVDDGSSDGTAEVAEAYARRDSRVRCVPNSQNQGAYPTRNNGMRMATGDFVTVHDSDDWSHPQKIERQVLPLLSDPTKVVSVSSWVRVTEDMRFVGPWLLSGVFVEKNHSSALLRRSALEQVGLWDEVSVAGDTEFLWRLETRFGHQAVVTVLPNTPLSFALADDNSLTRTKATHVKTIHYGLRRIYREAARWWHRKNKARLRLPEGGGRPFPVPVGIIRGGKSEVDAIVAANWAEPQEQLAEKLDVLNRLLGEGVSFQLLHWPSYFQNQSVSIADEVFTFCDEHGIQFAHVGLKVTAPTVYLLDESLWEHPPTHTAQVEEVSQVLNARCTVAEPQDELLNYFRQGGIGAAFE